MEQATLSIGAAARMTGINANTLRMWERRYQLSPSRRSAGGQREYSTTDIDHLRLIKKLVDQGMRIGDIAQLTTKTLTSLVIETVDQGGTPPEGDSYTRQPPLKTLVIGETLKQFFSTHIKRYPRLALSYSDHSLSRLVASDAYQAYKLVVIQQNALNTEHVQKLTQLCENKRYVVVFFFYSSEEVLSALHAAGVTLVRANPDTEEMDSALTKIYSLEESLTALGQSGQTFDISLPQSQPRIFDEATLVAAEEQTSKLNCECPPHLTDLIRRLHAFEDYSQTCGAENWKQAAVHACVYAYANQARYAIEKALRAVLDE